MNILLNCVTASIICITSLSSCCIYLIIYVSVLRLYSFSVCVLCIEHYYLLLETPYLKERLPSMLDTRTWTILQSKN